MHYFTGYYLHISMDYSLQNRLHISEAYYLGFADCMILYIKCRQGLPLAVYYKGLLVMQLIMYLLFSRLQI